MAITSGQMTAGTVATMVDGIHQMPYRITVHNGDQTDSLYLGNASVTTTDGFSLDKGQILQLVINPLDALFVVSTKGNHPVAWLRETL